MENETGRRIKKLRADNGREYVSQRMETILKNSGIQHQLTVPYSPQQNGLAERMNRTLVEKARSMIVAADLLIKYWAEAISTAAYLVNRSPTKSLRNMTPEEAWTGTKPDLSHLRESGCKTFAYILKEKSRKWDEKAQKNIFVGYCKNSVGYRLLDVEIKSVFKSRDVVFIEHPHKLQIEAAQKTNNDSRPIPFETFEKQRNTVNDESSEYETEDERDKESDAENFTGQKEVLSDVEIVEEAGAT